MFRLIKSSLLLLFSVWLLALPTLTSAQENSKPAFISDALYVFLHSGPNNQYRIIGTVNAGQSVTFLKEDSATGYAEIRVDGKTGWLPKEHVTYTPGLATQLENIKTEYAQINETVGALEQQRNQLNSQLNDAIAERQKALEQLEQTNRAYEQLKVQLENTQSPIWEKPMVLGSLILFVGLIFGLLLPLLMPKRRNSERW